MDAVAREGYIEETAVRRKVTGRLQDTQGKRIKRAPKKRKVENERGRDGREFWWRGSDLSDATAGSKLDILPPESALFSTNYFYLWLHDGYGTGTGMVVAGWVGGGSVRERGELMP